MEVQFKDVMIQELPTPTPENPDSPGFHLRTVKTDQGDRKYTVYLPAGYDGSRIYPVDLVPPRRQPSRARRNRAGAGRARPGDLATARAACPRSSSSRRLAKPGPPIQPTARPRSRHLSDVMTAYATDPKRVVLTGLSMGGRGSWELAAAHPEKFAAVVPICGPGRPDDAAKDEGPAGLELLRRRRP